jgi:hypothetical protein
LSIDDLQIKGDGFDWLRHHEFRDQLETDLRAQVDFLRKHAPPEMAKAASFLRRDWDDLSELAADKLGSDWRRAILPLLEITKRRLEMWETGRATIPDTVYLRLRAMPNYPDRGGWLRRDSVSVPDPESMGRLQIVDSPFLLWNPLYSWLLEPPPVS